MRFPAKKNAGCPKAPCDFPPKKMAFSAPVGLSWDSPPPQTECADRRTYGCTDVRMYGRTDGRTDGHVTITSQPKFLGLIGYRREWWTWAWAQAPVLANEKPRCLAIVTSYINLPRKFKGKLRNGFLANVYSPVSQKEQIKTIKERKVCCML